MKKTTILECATKDWDPSFFVPDEQDSEIGEWVALKEDADESDVERVAAALGLTPRAVTAIVGCLGELRDKVVEDLFDLFDRIEQSE